VGLVDALETGLRIVADLGEGSSIDFTFALSLPFFLMLRLILTSSLEADILRLRFRP
jgi:hypothetical protein